MPERKPDKTITIRQPSRITLGKSTIEISFSPLAGRPILKIWVNDSKTEHIHLAKLNPVSDTSG